MKRLAVITALSVVAKHSLLAAGAYWISLLLITYPIFSFIEGYSLEYAADIIGESRRYTILMALISAAISTAFMAVLNVIVMVFVGALPFH